MARAVAVLGVIVAGVFGGPNRAQAQDLDDVALEIVQVAAETGTDPVKLHGAVNSTGLRPRAYLIAVGELEPPAPPPRPRDAIDILLDCISYAESRNNPLARNPSGASGLFQFLPSTFRSTPPGMRGESIWDVSAQREAARYMVLAGRKREWQVVTRGLC